MRRKISLLLSNGTHQDFELVKADAITFDELHIACIRVYSWFRRCYRASWREVYYNKYMVRKMSSRLRDKSLRKIGEYSLKESSSELYSIIYVRRSCSDSHHILYRVDIVQLPTQEPQVAGRISMRKPLWQNSVLRIVILTNMRTKSYQKN